MGFEPTEIANTVTGDYYKRAVCDTEGCAEWLRLDATGPVLFHNAVAEAAKAEWLVIDNGVRGYPDDGICTFCQGCWLQKVTDRQANRTATA